MKQNFTKLNIKFLPALIGINNFTVFIPDKLSIIGRELPKTGHMDAVKYDKSGISGLKSYN
jgi:hypothetical protein